jgi:cytoskeletal protein CcmA (bactofilin family)
MAMMGEKKLNGSDIDEKEITTVVADDLEIKGTIRFKTSVMLKGIFEGEIFSDGLLVVGPTAKVTAAITTKTLDSHGEIIGNVTAHEQVVLRSSSTHTGDLKTPFLTIENGAVFSGKAVMESRQAVEIPVEGPGETFTSTETPEETPATTTHPQPVANEEKQEPFIIARQEQRRRQMRDKTPGMESEKTEENTTPAENTEPQDKLQF